MYALMMYGSIALMIVFIATITAGIVLGSIVAAMRAVQSVWHTDPVATPAPTDLSVSEATS